MKSFTLYEKLWKRHVVKEISNEISLLYIDRHLIYEVTSPQAFEGLRLSKRDIWRPDSNLATVDHNVPTRSEHRTSIDKVPDALARIQIKQLETNCKEFGVNQIGLSDPRQGIIHIIGPEQGLILPGMTVVAGDSHTSTHGALGALAFGIGTSEVEHVLATQCLPVSPMKTMRIQITGELKPGVSSKDIILSIIAQIGTAGATGYAVEFAGDTVSALSMESRMTLCNMAIEAGARVGLIAVDDVTIDYVRTRPHAPIEKQWEEAEAYWRTLVSDKNAKFDKTININASLLKPMVTWGTSPEMAVPVDAYVPFAESETGNSLMKVQQALSYMGLEGGTAVTDIHLDKIFIGSCTNARLEDLRAAAEIIKNRRIAPNITQALVVPGSSLVKRQAESEGLAEIFINAGFEWREPGCSMCLGMNDDRLQKGERCASTSNRNFEGRQGDGGRTHLVSPQMAAAAAIAGHFVDISKDF